ncbi:MAG: SufE family protein [Pseudomonadota bacterium]
MDQESTIPREQDRIREEFALFDDWRERIEYIMELGRDLPPIEEALKQESHKVHGCQSQVWMIAEPRGELLAYHGDSDAFIVKGLIALLMRLYSNRRPEEILDNPPQVFEDIGLGNNLTPGRSNGLYAMVKRIQELAAAHQDVSA